jgi:MFS family permease
MVIAELVTYRFDAIRHWRFGVPVTSLLYAVSFAVMAFVRAPLGLVVGRALEGLSAGARMPLLFRDAMTAEAKSRDRMLAAMNSLYAVGYVSGPFVADVALLGMSSGAALVAFGALSLVVGVAMEASRPRGMGLEKEEKHTPPPLQRFMLLFVGKFVYGFLLVSITSAGRPHLFSDRVSVVLLVLAIALMVGQGIGVRLVARAPIDVLGVRITVALAPLCVAYAIWPGSVTLIAAALVQGALLFVAVRAIGMKASDSKTYALFSALSDPGSALGAFTGRLGTNGALVVAVVALIPALLRVAAPEPASHRD